MHDKGSYADFVLQAGRYEQEPEGFDNTAWTSPRPTTVLGASPALKVGHIFSFGGGVDDRRWFNHWFLEPQLQLSYFLAKGADYTTSTGLKAIRECGSDRSSRLRSRQEVQLWNG